MCIFYKKIIGMEDFMKKDSKKLFNNLIGVVTVIATVTVIIALVNKYQKEHMPITDNPIVDSSSETNNSEGFNKPGFVGIPDSLEYIIVPDSKIKKLGEPVRVRNYGEDTELIITVNKVTKTKLLDDVGLTETDFALEPIGKNQNGEYLYCTFIFLDLTIKNNTKAPYEDRINYQLIVNDHSDRIGGEPRYKNIVHTQVDKDYWITRIDANEELNITYGYQVPDNAVDDKSLILSLNPSSNFDGDSDRDQFYIAINE